MSVQAAGAVLWLTGPPAAGKTTLAQAVAEALRQEGRPVEVLDGDEVRRRFWPELGYSSEDRGANVRRVCELAGLLRRHGVLVVVSLVSPERAPRDAALAALSACEVHVDAPLEVLAQRDPKGLYARAQRGEVAQFTGVSAPYEAPLAPRLHLRTDCVDVAQCVARIRAVWPPG